jgi:hypothetical protein
VLKRYHDQVQFFQVINEDWLTHIGRAKVYADQTAWFTELRREFPTVELGVCDCWSYDVSLQLPSWATVSAPMSLGSNSTAFKLIWDEQTGTLRVMPASEATVNGPT